MGESWGAAPTSCLAPCAARCAVVQGGTGWCRVVSGGGARCVVTRTGVGRPRRRRRDGGEAKKKTVIRLGGEGARGAPQTGRQCASVDWKTILVKNELYNNAPDIKVD